MDRAIRHSQIIGWIFIFAAYLVNTSGGPIGDDVTTARYFLLLALGFVFLSASQLKRQPKWLFRSIFECCIWNVCDELMHRACILDWWEIIGAVITFGGNFIFQYKDSIKRYIIYSKSFRKD